MMFKKIVLYCHLIPALLLLSTSIIPSVSTALGRAWALEGYDSSQYNKNNDRFASLNATTIELLVHDEVNGRRMQSGLAPLNLDSSLSIIARQHSDDMIDRGYFDHKTPDGLYPPDRYSKMQYHCVGKIGENIYFVRQEPSLNASNGLIALLAIQGWMHSEGHSKNILYSDFENEGIGVVINRTAAFVTEDFCT